jgi:hypothetical protein
MVTIENSYAPFIIIKSNNNNNSKGNPMNESRDAVWYQILSIANHEIQVIIEELQLKADSVICDAYNHYRTLSIEDDVIVLLHSYNLIEWYRTTGTINLLKNIAVMDITVASYFAIIP